MKKNKLNCILLLVLLVIFLVPTSKGQSFSTLDFARLDNFNHIPQTQSNWCWAAVSAEVINVYRNKNLKDCDIASLVFGQNCCHPMIGNSYNYPNSIFNFHNIVKPYGLTAKVYEQITWEEITFEIGNGRPVLIRVESEMGNGHFMLITGYDLGAYKTIDKLRKSLVISDPMYGYFKGDPDLIGYGVLWEDLNDGKFIDYEATWTNSVLFEEAK